MKSLASISLDLDNKWTYLKTHGDELWKTYPSYLGTAVPRILEFLSDRDLTISFFVVGRDAACEQHQDLFRAIADAGHEIGNHSFNHDPWLHLYSDQKLDEELARAEEHIERATGQRPIGFRGPGYSISQGMLRALAKRNYAYDATTFPNILNPLARAYFLAKSNLRGAERDQRKALFGSAKDALWPVKPYRWKLGERQLLEVPVTTMPLFKVPIHFSYLMYLSGYSSVLARWYFKTAMILCRATATQPSLLLHPLDFLGNDDDRDLAFFPGMNIASGRKLALLSEFLEILTDRFQAVSMREHVAAIDREGRLPVRKARFGYRDSSTVPANTQQ